jgi:hypothetical protein
MRVEPDRHEVRRLVLEVFRRLGTPTRHLFELQENVLIHDGGHFARSYRTDGLMAMWLVDAGIVQFYDSEGRMLRTVNLFEELTPLRAAA